MVKHILIFVSALLFAQVAIAQNHNIILGRPTDTSITESVQFDRDVQFYLELVTQSNSYTKTSKTYLHDATTPDEVEINGLFPNTQYFYRLQYKLPTQLNFTPTPQYTFHTQRPYNSEFTFTVEADEHLYDKKGVANMYKICLNNQALDKPDFMLSLGDTFGDDHNPFTITSAELDVLHKNYRQYLGSICHSIPFYISLGLIEKPLLPNLFVPKRN